MTPCERMKHLMFDFAEGNLDEKNRQMIQSHLEECPGCNRFVEQIRALRMRLSHLKPVQTSDDFILRLRSRIRQESGGRTVAERLLPGTRRWAPAVGLGVLSLSAAILLLDHSRQSPNSRLATSPGQSQSPAQTSAAQPVRMASESATLNESSKRMVQGEQKAVSKDDSSAAGDKLNDEARSRIRAVNY